MLNININNKENWHKGPRIYHKTQSNKTMAKKKENENP
jgi:hypothetical protein